MHDIQKTPFRKNAVASALALAIGTSVSTFNVIADTYVWTANTGGDVVFTLLDADGFAVANTSITARGANQYQTPTTGTLTYDTATDSGTATIAPFGFFNQGDAIASGITIAKVPAGVDDGSGKQIMANMAFDWNGNNGIPVSLVWDAQGLFGEMDGTPTSFTLIDDPAGVIVRNAANTAIGADIFSGTGGVPASDGTYIDAVIGYLGLGASPLAVTDFNTNNITVSADECKLGADADFTNNTGGGCMGINPSADLAQGDAPDNAINKASPPYNATYVGTGTGIGSNPMADGPFQGFNANFDFVSMTLTSFTDTTSPTLAMNSHGAPAGTTPLTLTVGVDTYSEPGATCTDAAPLNTNLNTSVVIAGDSVVDAIGTYSVTYNCQDASGNTAATETRVVNVVAVGVPSITLLGLTPVTHECSTPYSDAGATAGDFPSPPGDGDITGSILVTPVGGTITEGTVGVNTISYNVQDSGGTPAPTVTRTVNVVDTTKPQVTLQGNITDNIVSSTADNIATVPTTYTDPQATAIDSCDPAYPKGSLSATGGSVDMVVPDTGIDTLSYTLTYTDTDASGNSDTATRTVNVIRSQPVISLIGGGEVLNIGQTYTEQGMNITDAQDGNLNAVTTSGTASGLTYTVDASAVDTSTTGSYTVIYNVTDSDGNLATQVTRSVQVGIFAVGSNFTMLEAAGNVFGGTNDVLFDWDQTVNTSVSDLNFNMSITSQKPFPFFGFVWTAHDIRVFGPGTYSFDTGCSVAQVQANGCPAGTASGATLSMTVGPGQVGAHILFDWNTSKNIDVVNVWDVDGVWNQHGDVDPKNKLYNGKAGDAPDPTTTWKLVSTDANGDGINGIPMVDGPFQGFYASFNAGPAGTAPPPAPYTGTAPDTTLGDGLALNIWGLFAGLLTLLGFRRLGKK